MVYEKCHEALASCILAFKLDQLMGDYREVADAMPKESRVQTLAGSPQA